MPITVHIQGVGTVHFPDGMDQAAITREVEQLTGGASQPLEALTPSAPMVPFKEGMRPDTGTDLGANLTIARENLPGMAAAAASPATGGMSMLPSLLSAIGAGAAGAAGRGVLRLANREPAGTLHEGLTDAATQGLAQLGGNTLQNVPGLLKAGARKLYQGALKPTKATLERAPAFRAGGGQEAARKELADTGLGLGAGVTAKGRATAAERIESLDEEITAALAQGDAAGKTIDPQAVARRLDEVAATMQQQTLPSKDLRTVDRAKTEFLKTRPGPLSVQDAQKLKRGEYLRLKKSGYGEMKSAEVEARKGLARGLKEEIVEAVPEVAPLNAEQAKAINLQRALDDAMRRTGNRDALQLGEQVLLAGRPKAAILALLNRPSVASGAARLLHRTGEQLPDANLANAIRLLLLERLQTQQ